jgi:hypothetical protein
MSAAAPSSASSSIEQPEYIWSRINVASGAAPSARRYSIGGWLPHTGHLLVWGGFDARKEALNDAYVYHSGQSSWTVFAQRGSVLPSPRYGSACWIVDTSNHGNSSSSSSSSSSKCQVWLFGGAGAKNAALNDLFLLDVDADGLGGTWTLIPDAPGAPSKRYFAATCATHGSLFLHGGEVNIKRQLADFFAFDVATRQWREIKPTAPLPVLRAGHILFTSAASAASPSIYLYGGYTGEGGYDALRDTLRIDVVKLDQWHTVAVAGALPAVGRPQQCVRIAQPTDAAKGDYLFVFGGYDGAVRQPVGTLHRLTLNADGSLDETNGWLDCKLWLELGDDLSALAKGSKGTFPTPRYGFVIGVDPKTLKATVFGGSGSTYLNDVMALSLED